MAKLPSDRGGFALFKRLRRAARHGIDGWAAGRSPVPGLPTAAALRIPFEKDTVDGYIAALDSLVRATGTRIYVDTSFLVWLTALGSEARTEFVDWLRGVAPGRVHVPVWSAHEYLRHHVNDLHGKKLKGVESGLNDLAKNTFKELRPYIDTTFSGDSRSASEIIAATRSALIDVKRIAGLAAQWKKQHYERNAEAVISLINEFGLDSPPLLDWLGDIQNLEQARYDGRIPPGFQDRNKSATDNDGSNSFGDLVFWKEVLHHAKQWRAGGVLIISNDGKNDWVIGGQDQPELDQELKAVANWLPPIPRPQPMLEYEARASAGIRDLMLVDRRYLAIYLRRTGSPSERFFGAAIDVTIPSPGKEDRANQKRTRDEAIGRAPPRNPEKSGDAGPKHLPVDDGPNVADNPLALRLALSGSAAGANDIAEPLLTAMLAADAEGRALETFLNRETLLQWDGRAAAWFARTLGARSISGNQLASTYATDLLGVFDRLPPKTATNLYLGLLAAAYVDDAELRTIPRAPWLTQLLALQAQPRAKVAIEGFRRIVADWPGRPVYLPDPERPVLSVRPLLEKSAGLAPRLAGLQIAGIGVIVEAQDEVDRRLVNRFPDAQTVVLGEVVKDACNALGIPFGQVEAHEALERLVSFGETVGIAAEADLDNDMEDKE